MSHSKRAIKTQIEKPKTKKVTHNSLNFAVQYVFVSHLFGGKTVLRIELLRGLTLSSLFHNYVAINFLLRLNTAADRGEF